IVLNLPLNLRRDTDRFANRAKSLAPQQDRQILFHRSDQTRTFVDESRVKLDQARAGLNVTERIISIHDAAHTDYRKLALRAPINARDPIAREIAHWTPAKAAVFSSCAADRRAPERG